jgi:hypothetical protein
MVFSAKGPQTRRIVDWLFYLVSTVKVVGELFAIDLDAESPLSDR